MQKSVTKSEEIVTLLVTPLPEALKFYACENSGTLEEYETNETK